MEENTFYTLKGYQLMEAAELTYAMEDYLEMSCRIMREQKRIRVREIARRLNVRPSSASKMIQSLCALGYMSAEKYGSIALTEKGEAAGEYLLRRHAAVNTLLCLINGTCDEPDETEKIEHFLSARTVGNIAALIRRLEDAEK